MLEAERDDGGLHGAARLLAPEHLHQPGPQLVGVQLAGVDHQVGPVPQPAEQEPLVGDGVDHPPGGLGVSSAGPLEPPDQHVVGGVEEEDAHPVPARLERIDGREHVVEVSPAASHHEGHPLQLGPGAVHQLRDLRDERRRHVVDHEPAQVLQRGPGRRPSGPGHAGHHQVFAHRSTSAYRPAGPFGAMGVCSRSKTDAPTSAGNHDTPSNSSLDTFRRAARPPNCSIRRSRRFGPQSRRPRPGRRRSSVCPAGCGGTRWRTGGPRPAGAGAGRGPRTAGTGGRARSDPAGRPPRSSWPGRRSGSGRSAPDGPSTRMPTLSWPRPPSSSRSWGG